MSLEEVSSTIPKNWIYIKGIFFHNCTRKAFRNFLMSYTR